MTVIHVATWTSAIPVRNQIFHFKVSMIFHDVMLTPTKMFELQKAKTSRMPDQNSQIAKWTKTLNNKDFVSPLVKLIKMKGVMIATMEEMSLKSPEIVESESFEKTIRVSKSPRQTTSREARTTTIRLPTQKDY